MKEIKDIFEHYEQNPSEDVWNRLSARLDAEMPVAQKVARRGMSTAWKWAAAVITAVVVLGGAALFTRMHGTHQHNDNVVEQKSSNTEIVVTENESIIEKSEEPLLADNRADKEVAPAVEKKSTEVVPTAMASEPVAKNVAKTNVRQEVLPANSTLAKQLAVDPVLKNLSDGSVDWSMPAHLSIPNLFTPNDDGVNDMFVIEGIEHYASPKLVVRDKNNRIVYQSADYQNTWGGENCSDGVYHYEFTFSYNGIENQATGKVRIIRS